jgi:hypothetical protein
VAHVRPPTPPKSNASAFCSLFDGDASNLLGPEVVDVLAEQDP